MDVVAGSGGAWNWTCAGGWESVEGRSRRKLNGVDREEVVLNGHNLSQGGI